MRAGSSARRACEQLRRPPTHSTHEARPRLWLLQEDLNKDVTDRILRYWVPWLNRTRVSTNITPNKPHREVLSPEQEQVVRAVAAPEFALYEVAKEQYSRQLQHLRSVNLTAPCAAGP